MTTYDQSAAGGRLAGLLDGRIGRARFFFYNLGIWLFWGMGVSALMRFAPAGGSKPLALAILTWVSLAGVAAFSWTTTVKRVHDMDRSAWYSLGLLVPLLNVVLVLMLSFKRGTVGPNRYGPDPEPDPLSWIPTLYFAEGLPYFVVATIAGLMYKSRGVSNEQIAWWTGALGFVWVFKPAWSPFLEAFRSKKKIVVVFQLAGGICLGLVALSLPLPGYFTYTIALLALVSICSATHDIAADGTYIASLTPKEQATYAGWQGGFYNVARFFSIGGLVMLAGGLEKQMDVAQAWLVVFSVLALIMIALSVYHMWSLPATTSDASAGSMRNILDTLRDVVATFFEKKNILLMIAFIILFRAGEGQVTTIGPLFLKDTVENGGLGLSTDQIGAVYGTVASLAFIGGSILGGYFTSWLGLRRAMFFLILAMNLPNLAYFFLSTAMPTSTALIALALSIEMFGYGFGFVGLILFMMQEVAPGKYQTAHYALATGFMQLGYVLFKMVSGTIQEAMGYKVFFIWVLVSAIPALILSKVMPFRSRDEAATEAPAAEPAQA